MSMKKNIFAGILVTGALALSACAGSGGGAANTPGGTTEINLLGYAAIFQDNYTKAVIDKFEDKHPNIKVNFVPAQNSAEMLGKLRTEKGNPTVDIAIMDASVANTANHEGLFRKISTKDVPNLANVVPLGQNADGYGPAVTFDNLVLLYNPKEVSSAPTKLADLWNAPNNSVAIPAPPDIQGIAFTILTDNRIGSDYKKSIDPAIKEIAKLGTKVTSWDPKPDVYQTVTSGAAKYAIGWNARGQVFSAGSNGALKVVQPSDGVAFQINTINAVEGSKNTAAVNTFLDYALSAEAQQDFTDAMYYAPTVKNATISDKAKALVADPSDPNIVPIDWIWMADKRDAWTNQWRRSVIGG